MGGSTVLRQIACYLLSLQGWDNPWALFSTIWLHVEDETGTTALLLHHPAAARRRQAQAAPATCSRRQHLLQGGLTAKRGAWAGGRRAAEGERRGRAVPRAQLAGRGRRAPVLWRRQAVLGGLSVSAVFELSQFQVLFLFVGLLFVWSVDLIYFNGGVRNLVLDTVGHNLSQKYHNRVIQHEAGHFLIAYLLGVLPKEYTITSLDTLMKQGSLNVQAGTAFVDFEFVEEINTGKLSAMMLNKFSCIALAGVATEYLLYGYAEGGLADVNKLDGLFKSLGFTQNKADSQVRWAVLNTVLILRRHEDARSKLAEAMSSGRSVGSCIEVIEENVNTEDI
ncbi:uncharacterized protein LOC100844265 isoform X2 [Brachypodium distachyon]|uniref:uncharacterized protein LOC100844265 isoform X2 n=1 Tax=Brachypodium distachyon TaxID=15368 RepID=UPI00071CA198|nr:uncharacterized protein LOC100844265 isoform X2 [Brachypodium distachyon]|eukprot:XP_014755272.1 uncharacterized protein LOC100844265 isoform X2 [Brachypodium distachyon]